MVARRARRGRGRDFILALVAPCLFALVIGVLASTLQLAAADAEVYPEYHRPTKQGEQGHADEAAAAAAAPKPIQPYSQSEDEFVEAMLRGSGSAAGAAGDSRDLQAERERWFQAREEAKLQRQLQAEREELLKLERADLQPEARTPPPEPKQQQQQQQQQPMKPEPKPESPKIKQTEQPSPKTGTAKEQEVNPGRASEELSQRWQQAAKAALAQQKQQQQQQPAAPKQQQLDQQEAERALIARQEAAEAALVQQQQQLVEQAKQEQAERAAVMRQQQQQQLLRQQQQQLAEVMEALGALGALGPLVDDGVDGGDDGDGKQQGGQMAGPLAGPLPVFSLLDPVASRNWQAQMERHAQQQQRDQDQYQQPLIDQQNEHLGKDTRGRARPPYTYDFDVPKSSSPFAVGPAEPKFYQGDVRLPGLLSPPQLDAQDEQDEAGAGVGPSGLGRGASSEQHEAADDLMDADEDLGAVDGDGLAPFLADTESIALQQAQRQMLRQQLLQQQLMQQQKQRLHESRYGVTAPIGLVQGRHQSKPTVTRDSRTDEDRDRDRSSNLSAHDYPVVKKQLTFPKDHWFFGMDDVGKLAIFIGCSFAVSSLILGFIVWQYRLHRNAKAAADVEYPAYGVTGPNKDISPTGDRRLAQSAQMYHYQHQKQQILAMESRAGGGRRGSMSEAESEDENEEGDYTVYECPGLAPTQEMEVKNPLFQDDPTPATPAVGDAGQDGDSASAAGSKKASLEGGRPGQLDGKPTAGGNSKRP